jgi:hypothetical protein
LQRWHGRRNKRQPRPSGRQLTLASTVRGTRLA